MCWVKGKRWLVSAIIAIATMCVVTLTVGTLPAKAAENRDSEYFLYTLITNE